MAQPCDILGEISLWSHGSYSGLTASRQKAWGGGGGGLGEQGLRAKLAALHPFNPSSRFFFVGSRQTLFEFFWKLHSVVETNVFFILYDFEVVPSKTNCNKTRTSLNTSVLLHCNCF